MENDSNTSRSMLKNISFNALFFLLGILICLPLTMCHKSKKNEQIIDFRVDTLIVTHCDTFRYEKIRIKNNYIYDTILINDTVYIKDEPQHYIDSTENYKIDINSVKLYDYSLDIYKVDTIYQIKEKVSYMEEKSHWKQFVGVGVGIGYGGCIGVDKTIRLEPYVGIHLTYGFGYSW